MRRNKARNPYASRHRLSVPWSAHEEKWLGLIVWLDWPICWALVNGAIVCLGFKLWITAGVLGIGAAFFAIDGMLHVDEHRRMMLNKPRSVQGLTEWIQLRPWQTEICCACGRIVHIAGAPWYPNHVDRGGGRFSIVCPCGIGYYKLRDL